MAQSASKSCDICVSGPGRNYCEQCDQWLCESCKALHLRSKISRKHIFLSELNINPEDKPLCKEHNENFIFYCIDCDIPICKMCIVKKHKTHDTSEINESTQELQAEVKNAIESKLKSVKTNLDKIGQDTERYQSDVKEAVRTIIEEGKQMKEYIDKKIQALISSLEEKEAASLQALRSISTGFQNDIDKIKKCQNAYTDRKKIVDPTKLLKELKHIKFELDVVVEKKSPVMPNVKHELEICREELSPLVTVNIKDKLKLQEDEMKKMKEELDMLEQKTNSPKEEGESGAPMAQRMCFTRVEMTRVLIERNQYKERLMELQEAVRWTEMTKASKEIAEQQKKKKSSIWNYFTGYK